MRVALVYDRITKWGGAERVLLALHELWPRAPLYTAVYDADHSRWASVLRIRPSFINALPFAKKAHELVPWLTPMAFETFTFDDFDVVISVTSAEAKNIITKPATLHICYCLTPTRYLWSGLDEYLRQPGLGILTRPGRAVFKRVFGTLRRWDLVAGSRPDYYIAISHAVKERIERTYKREVARVIFPPVDTEKFGGSLTGGKPPRERYYLTVSRLVPYKRVDLLIDAFNMLGWPLVIVGTGRDKRRLAARAKKNIVFLGHVGESELMRLYAGAHAFVYAGTEDFGIVAAEAQAAGKPVVANASGGMAEIVIPAKTGELFHGDSLGALVAALQKVSVGWYDSALCRKNAERFSKARFNKEMKGTVESLYNTYLRSLAG